MYLERLLDALRGKRRIAVVTHRHADIDAVGCALVLKEVLEQLGYEASVVCPEGVAKEAKPFISCSEEMPASDLAVLVDVASAAQVPGLKPPVFAVDHHAAGDEMPGIRVERPSCSEIALEIAREAGVRPSREALIAAALGMYADSVRLLRADGATLRILADAVDVVGPLEQYVGRQREEDRGLKMAKAHALARLSVYEGNRGVICATHVDAYESDVANALTSAGCDVSIVASRHGEEVRLILRSRSIDVAALAADIASILGGGGGGHRGAAAVSIKRRMCKDELPRLLSEVVKLVDASARRLD